MELRLCNASAPSDVGVAGLVCVLPTGHPGAHAVELMWVDDAVDSWTVIEPVPHNPARELARG